MVARSLAEHVCAWKPGMGPDGSAQNSICLFGSGRSLVAEPQSCRAVCPGSRDAVHPVGNVGVYRPRPARAGTSLRGAVCRHQYHRVLFGAGLLFFLRVAVCSQLFDFLRRAGRIHSPIVDCQLRGLCVVVSGGLWSGV